MEKNEIREIEKRENENRELDTLPLPIRLLIRGLCIVFALGFLFNMLVLVNAQLEKYDYATAFGFSPIAVVPSEEGAPEDIVEGGDLLFAIERPITQYEEGDSVAYWINGTLLIGKISYIEGDPENPIYYVRPAFSEKSFANPASEESLLGEICIRIPYLGYFVLFLTTLVGRLFFVGIPFLIYLILMLVEIRRERREEAEWEDEKHLPEPVPGGRAGRICARTARQMRRYAPWAFLMTAVITAAAIRYGTSESRRLDRQAKRMEAANRDGSAKSFHPMVQNGKFVRTKKMRSTRSVRSVTPRTFRSATPIRPYSAKSGRL